MKGERVERGEYPLKSSRELNSRHVKEALRWPFEGDLSESEIVFVSASDFDLETEEKIALQRRKIRREFIRKAGREEIIEEDIEQKESSFICGNGFTKNEIEQWWSYHEEPPIKDVARCFREPDNNHARRHFESLFGNNLNEFLQNQRKFKILSEISPDFFLGFNNMFVHLY